jgi:hypothetical protein
MVNPWHTIHIFGLDTVQVISDTQNVQVAIADVQAQVEAVIDNVWAGKPEDYTGAKTYRSINIFNTLFSDWVPNNIENEPFRVEFDNLNQSLLDDLAQAVFLYPPPEE